MLGRLGLGVATAVSLLSAGGLYAQGPAPAMAPQAFNSNAYPGSAAGPPFAAQAGTPFSNSPTPAFGPPQQGPPLVAPIGYNAQQSGGGAACPGGCPSAYNSMPGCGNAEAADDFVETPWEQLICRVLRNVDVRVDYINWGISRPRTVLIGENPGPGVLQPIFNEFGPVQVNATDKFPILDDNFNQIGQARAYDTTGISLSENSGFQVTFSLPMTYGTIEVSGFLLGKANSAPNPGGLPAGIPGVNESFAALPVKVDGQTSSVIGLFSQGFDQSFSSFIFGSETNVYFNAIVPKDYGLLIRPMVGFRYLGIDEHFNVLGINPGPSFTTVESSTINNIYGPTIGCRFELSTQWFSIGLDPRVTFGVNQFASNLSSSDSTIGNSHDHEIDARFAPVGAIDCFIKVPIQEHFRLYAAYNLFGVANISRPQEQVDYDISSSFQNHFHLDLASAPIMVQGFSVGCEFNF